MTRADGSATPGKGAVGQIDQANPVEGLDPASLEAILLRTERSTSLEHMIYREAELDEVWRLLDEALREARHNGIRGEPIELLTALKDVIFKAHDLVGVDSNPRGAAAELREGLFLARKYSNLRP